MNKAHQKKLKLNFFNKHLWIFVSAITIISLLLSIKAGTYVPLVFQMGIYILEALFLRVMYVNRIKAKAVLLAELSQLVMIVGIISAFFCIDITPFKKMGLILGVVCSLVVISLSFFSELRFWEQRKKFWEQNQKLDVSHGIFSLIRGAGPDPEYFDLIYLVMIIPIAAGITMVIFNHMANSRQIMGEMASPALLIVLSIALGKKTAIYWNIAKLERKLNIVLKTEYRSDWEKKGRSISH